MHGNIQEAFGQAIRKLRMEQGISQEKFAHLCNLHRTYISDIERGVRNISLENIDKMAIALNIKISDIFKEVENDESI
ncbi:helix-turn-helix domain-containing protein [uncultured Megasphaera sp.]|uniref:helix-turn-helix domain-containing protein n=1 Tax=uncultured Megasphaera sp. TaxID=165188 RepID=UPI0026256758|nr:helix-turn-helix transcriptional regulator [uncultured Megasphaera sp.]